MAEKPETSELATTQRRDSSSWDKDDLASAANLKTRHGIILMPQPSDDPNDPLNWSSLRKHMAMATISYLAFVCYMTVTALVPGTLELAKQFHVAKSKAVYLGSTPVALYGVGPFLWSPMSHFIGRRPVMLLSNIIAIIGTVVAASANSYGACMAGRVIMGFGGSASWCLGPPSIGDMFFRHEKGKKIGTSTLAIVVSPFAGGIIGGAIINNKSLGWRWSQWVFLILMGAGLVAQIFFVPETIYIRSSALPIMIPPKATLWSQYGIRIPKREAGKKQGIIFVATRPLVMFKFPVVVLASLWFGVAYMMHVGLTSQIPLIFEPAPYNFTVLDVGLSAFSGLIGALIGEAYAGPAIDLIAKRALKQETEWKPEMRLKAIWPALVTAPAGLIMFGVSIQFGKSWVTPLVGQGIYIFGIEIGTTVMQVLSYLQSHDITMLISNSQTYLLESYPRQGPEASLVFNLARNLMSYTAPFFVQPMLAEVKGSATFGIFAALIVFFFPFTIGVLMWRGREIRERSGDPGWSRD